LLTIEWQPAVQAITAAAAGSPLQCGGRRRGMKCAFC
jgi:hypothetical protein